MKHDNCFFKFPYHNLTIALLVTLSLGLSSCGYFNKNQNVATSTTANNQGNAATDQEILNSVPPNILNIPGIPIPTGVNVSLSDTVIVGGDENWTGQVVMNSAEYKPLQLVEFMRKAMPQYGWVETAIVRSRRTSITFINGERYATLRIQPLDKGSEIDLVVSPSGQMLGSPMPAMNNMNNMNNFQPPPPAMTTGKVNILGK